MTPLEGERGRALSLGSPRLLFLQPLPWSRPLCVYAFCPSLPGCPALPSLSPHPGALEPLPLLRFSSVEPGSCGLPSSPSLQLPQACGGSSGLHQERGTW